MATVRLSDELKGYISTAAKNLYTKRIEQANKFFMDKHDLGELIYNGYLDDSGHRKEFNSLPVGWFPRKDSVHYKTINGFAPRETKMPLHGQHPMPVPLLQTHYLGGNDTAITCPAIQPTIDDWRTWQSNLEALEQEQAEFQETVETFMSRHTTLRQAVAEWPAFWELVPQHYKDRHNKVVDRAASGRAEQPEFDVEQLTAKVVIAKVTES